MFRAFTAAEEHATAFFKLAEAAMSAGTQRERERERERPTVVGDFTGHQIELLQTSALLGDDFHAPATRGGIMHESGYRRSPGGAVSPVKTRGGRLPL